MTTQSKYNEPTGSEKAGFLHYSRPASPWENFQKTEGIPIWKGVGMWDSRELPRGDWERTGGKGTYIQLFGTNNSTGMFCVEVPSRGALKPQKHFYEERYIVLEGRGSTEVWKDGSTTKSSFEWQAWSVFSMPINSWFRIVNAGSAPALLLAVNTAPPIMNMFQSYDFIFNNPYSFEERWGGNIEDFWKPADEYEPHPVQGRAQLTTNLFPDAQSCYLPLDNNRGPGYRWVYPQMVGNTMLGGFIAEYPPGRYAKAHHHGSGAVLVCMRGKGYSITWPKDEAGLTPWKNGKGDMVQMQEYGLGGMISAAPGPSDWFHQHFATAAEPFRVFNFSGGSAFAPGGTNYSLSEGDQVAGVGAEIGDGGRALPYHMEDPHIREYYTSRLKEEGAKFDMPEEVYTAAGANIKVIDA